MRTVRSEPFHVTGRGVGVLRIVGYGSFILIGWNTVLLPSLIRSIETDFSVTDAGFGLLYLWCAVSYAGSALMGGLLLERVGRKIVLPGVALLCAVGLCTQAIAPWWVLLVAGAVAMNSGQSVIDAGVNALFLDLFRSSRGNSMNLLHVFFSIGALAAPIAIGALVSVGLSWRGVMGVTALSFALIALALAWSRPPGQEIAQARDETEAPGEDAASRLPFAGLACAIACYVAAELGVSSWVVRYLAAEPLVVATGVLSAFWIGLTLGRVAGGRLADRWEHQAFTIGCLALASLSLTGAVLVPGLALSAVLFTLAGFFYGPVYPMVMAIGGAIYPHRTSALSGSLTMSAAVGGIIYPPLMGLMASSLGLRIALLGAACLGLPAIVGILLARPARGSG